MRSGGVSWRRWRGREEEFGSAAFVPEKKAGGAVSGGEKDYQRRYYD